MSVTEIEALRLEQVRKTFASGAGWSRRGRDVHAVDGIDLLINRGEILGLVGESGSGKSTLGELIVALQEPTGGRILYEGTDLAGLRRKQLKTFRRRAQMVFQDPYGTLNPRFTTWQTVVEPVVVAGIKAVSEQRDRVRLALERSGLVADDTMLAAYPHELSGGQRQRVAIARAIVMEPSLLVADEPVSMLDVSIRSGILNLLLELREKLELTIVYISHDLSSVHSICDRIAIMYLGRIVEVGRADVLVEHARHPYTRALLGSVPTVDPGVKRERPEIGEQPMSSVDVPPGCRFAPRCAFATSACDAGEPELAEHEPGWRTRCIHPREEPLWTA